MACGYYQVQLYKDSIEYIAFVTSDGQFEFTAMPFGLKNAPSRCIGISESGNESDRWPGLYMDDIMIVAPTNKDAFERLETVLNI